MAVESGVSNGSRLRWLVHLVSIALVLSWFVPILALLSSSLRTQADTAESGWWNAFLHMRFTLGSYRQALDDVGILGSLGTSLAIAIPTTIATTVLSVVGAFALTKMRFAGRTLVSILLVGLLVMPPQITLVPLLKLYQVFGLTGTIPGIWLYQMGFTLPFGIFLIRGFVSSIPSELFESAAIDGASMVRVFRSIVIPLTAPVMASLAILQFLWSWNDLLIPLIFLGGSDFQEPVTVELAGLLHQTAQGQGPLMAATFMAVAIPLIIVVALQRYFVRGVLGGAVKG